MGVFVEWITSRKGFGVVSAIAFCCGVGFLIMCAVGLADSLLGTFLLVISCVSMMLAAIGGMVIGVEGLNRLIAERIKEQALEELRQGNDLKLFMYDK